MLERLNDQTTIPTNHSEVINWQNVRPEEFEINNVLFLYAYSPEVTFCILTMNCSWPVPRTERTHVYKFSYVFTRITLQISNANHCTH